MIDEDKLNALELLGENEYLHKELERLNQEIRCLNNCIIKFHSEFCNKQAEINRLNNIINELEKHFEFLKMNSTGGNKEFFEDILDYIKALRELKGSDEE